MSSVLLVEAPPDSPLGFQCYGGALTIVINWADDELSDVEG